MRKEAFFALNRMVLIAVVVFSFIIPLLYLPSSVKPIIQEQIMPQVSFYESETELTTAVEIDKTTVSASSPVTIQKGKTFHYSARQIILIIYLSGVIFSFLGFIHGIASILWMLRKAKPVRKVGYLLFILEKDIPAFSFCKMVFISRSDYSKHGNTILAHEQQHIRLGHFYDLMLMETAKMAHWFNPVIYWLIQDLKAIHEFQADQHTLSKGIDANKYQLLIIEKGVGSKRFALANSFNHCQIKKRITMMNKSKTSKAGIWKVATFLPLLALLLIFCSRKSEEGLPANSIHLKNQTLKLDQSFLLFDSSKQPFTFELSLIGGNVDAKYNFDDTTKVKQLIWFSLIPKDRFWLEDGEYKFSSSTLNSRPQMSFTGKVRIGSKEMDINGGDLMCKEDSGKINITFNLEVEDDQIKGSYTGTFNEISRMPLADSTEAKSRIVSATPDLSIVFKMDGNYINGEKYSFDDFVAKLKAYNQVDLKSRGIMSYRFDPHVMESIGRNREITAISKATYMPFFSNMNVDQQAIFPGGTEGMFDWIKQNIRYPEGDKYYLTRRDVGVEFEVNENGKVVNPKVVESINPTLDAEAIRVISQMPSWQPAIRKGARVSVKERISVPFYPQK
ncbi:MAG: energy transducer TonB [Methylococcaceae bacterium]